jgi:hypothetical protein
LSAKCIKITNTTPTLLLRTNKSHPWRKKKLPTFDGLYYGLSADWKTGGGMRSRNATSPLLSIFSSQFRLINSIRLSNFLTPLKKGSTDS